MSRVVRIVRCHDGDEVLPQAPVVVRWKTNRAVWRVVPRRPEQQSILLVALAAAFAKRHSAPSEELPDRPVSQNPNEAMAERTKPWSKGMAQLEATLTTPRVAL
jgi:hypothetical protein